MRKYLRMSSRLSSPAKKADTDGTITARTLFRDAWALVSHSRALWWLGVVAGLGQGYGMNPQVTYQLDQGKVRALETTISRSSPALTLIMLIAVLLLIAVWVVSMMAEAGLMRSVREKQEEKSTSFRSGLALGRPALWPLIKLNIVVAVFSFFLVLLVGIPAVVVLATNSLGMVAGAVGVLLILVYGVLLALLYPWMTRFVVLGRQSPIPAIRSAWQLLKTNTGLLIRLGLGGLLIQLVGVLIIGLATIVILIPLLVLGIIAFRSDPVLVLWPILVGVVAVAIFLAGILTALKNAYYTLAYQKLSASGP